MNLGLDISTSTIGYCILNKDKIEKMLSNYDKRINELEKQIKILEEENSKLFSELPKYKQKKFKKD